MLEKEAKNVVWYHSCRDDKYIYAVEHGSNILMQIDKNTYQVEALCQLSDFKKREKARTLYTCLYGNRIYIFTIEENEVAEYDIETGELNYFYPESRHRFSKTTVIFRDGDTVWSFAGAREEYACTFSLKDHQYDYKRLTADKEEVAPARVNYVEPLCFVERAVWRCVLDTNIVYSIDIDTLEVKSYKLDVEERFWSILYQNGCFFILSFDGKTITCWDKEKGITKVWKTGYAGDKEISYRELIPVRNGFLLLSSQERRSILNVTLLENGQVERTELVIPQDFIDMTDIYKQRSQFMDYFIENNKLYLSPFCGNGMLEVDLQTFDVEYHLVQMEVEEYLDICYKAEKMLPEEVFGIHGLVRNIMKHKKSKNRIESAIGQRCWEIMKDI